MPMLEQTRKRGASFLVYLIFGLLIVVFVINFGPQSQGSEQGCGGRTAGSLLTVDEVDVPRGSFLLVYQGFFSSGQRVQRAAATIDALTRRELLAQEADERGLIVTDELVDAAIKDGWIYGLLGRSSLKPKPGEEARGYFRRSGDDVFFDYKMFERWVGGMNLSVGSYKAAQKREMLATMMAEILRGQVQVSRDEAQNDYVYTNTTVTFDAVRFDPAEFRAAMKLTEADTARYLAAHEADVKAKYTTDERLYKGTKPQLYLRTIQLAKATPPAPAAPAPAPAPVPGAGSGSAAAAPPAGSGSAVATAPAPAPTPAPDPAPVTPAKPDPAFEKLQKAREEIVAKKKKFADVAKVLNDDPAERATGGLVGWRTVDAPRLGDPALSAAVKTLEPGGISEVITTDSGFYLVTAEDKREGDLSFDQVKLEIADTMARDVWSKEAAKRAALTALADARAKKKNLDELYEKGEGRRPPGGGGLPPGFEQILNDPNLTPEQKQQFIEQFMKMQQGGAGRTGSITLESSDIPAKWAGDEEPAAGPAAPAAGAGAAPAAGSAAPAAGSAAPAAGSAAPAAPAAPSAPVETPPLEPSKDELPAFDPVKATVERLGPMPRIRGDNETLGASQEMIAAMFDTIGTGELGPKVYAVGDSYVILQLAQKELADVTKFEKDAEAHVRRLRDERGAQFLDKWIQDRCDALHKAGKIKPDMNLFEDEDEKGNKLPVTYEPCNF
jgi:hypothetical protein